MKRFALLLLLAPFAAFAAPTGSITVSPATGVAPYAAKVVWNLTEVTACTASDGWTGAKAVSGSVDVTITKATKFVLTCTGPGGATITWTPPTTNTDGSALTDLAGYNIYRGASATTLTGIAAPRRPGEASYVDVSLPAGKYFYAVQAVNAAGATSDVSVAASVTVAGVSWTGNASAAVQTVPSPPTNLKTVETFAYRMRQAVDGYSFVSIGAVPLGVECKPLSADAEAARFTVVPRANVKLASKFDTLPLVVFARCG